MSDERIYTAFWGSDRRNAWAEIGVKPTATLAECLRQFYSQPWVASYYDPFHRRCRACRDLAEGDACPDNGVIAGDADSPEGALALAVGQLTARARGVAPRRVASGNRDALVGREREVPRG